MSFPGCGIVEMARSRCAVVPGQPFVVEDFEIRKPLILPNPPWACRASYSPNNALFHQSRFDSVTWSLRGGSMCERTESIFASSKWRNSTLNPLRWTFLPHASDLGLRYGEESTRSRVSAGAGRSAGRVVLSDALSRAGEYALHPVLFDGALPFSAGAATVEGVRLG
jgi:hypothetical protein